MKFSMFLLAAIAFGSEIPRTWTDAAVAELEVPLVNPKYSPIHISEKTYYQIPTRTIYLSYPIYHPSREPAGYTEWLKQQEPEIAFGPANPTTPEDWIKAGEIVFNAPVSYRPVFFSAEDLRDPAFFEQT